MLSKAIESTVLWGLFHKWPTPGWTWNARSFWFTCLQWAYSTLSNYIWLYSSELQILQIEDLMASIENKPRRFGQCARYQQLIDEIMWRIKAKIIKYRWRLIIYELIFVGKIGNNIFRK